MSLCDRKCADAATGTVVVVLVQTYYGVVSEKSREHFAAQRRARNRKAYLCIYSQLCVFESESYFGNLTDAMKARSYAFQDADDFPNYAKQQGVTHLTKSVRVHAERVPQLPWDLQREFFESYCGVPELLMMTSRQFQHDAFQRDMEDVFSLGRKAYVGVCVSCSNGRVARSRVGILVLCLEGGMLSVGMCVCGLGFPCSGCDPSFTRRMREFTETCEAVHAMAPPRYSDGVPRAGPKSFVDQCELLGR